MRPINCFIRVYSPNRFDGKEKRLSLGVYPNIGIKAAREKYEQVRKQLAAGIDPSVQRQVAKTTRMQSVGDTFEIIAREWYTPCTPPNGRPLIKTKSFVDSR